MSDALSAAIKVAASGLSAQSTRLRVVAENMANAQSTGDTPGADPYTRKTVSFSSALDRANGVDMVRVSNIGTDNAPYVLEYDPSHPAADKNGFVKMPNVNMMVEMADMREANRSYEADLQVVKQARALITMTIDLLRGN